MSVIVKGMEMPTCCEWCAVEKYEQNSDGYIIDSWCPVISNEPSTLKIRTESRHSLCPLRPLPEKHGRLIDDSQLRETFGMSERCNECKQDEWDCKYNQLFTRMDFCGWLDEMDTIVEAEGDDG